MKAIILAAGQGQRLRPLTNNNPKVMVEISGKTILERQVENFINEGITDITVVTGYCADSVKCGYPIHYCSNLEYERTNMAFSLYCAQQQLHGDVIISYGDIIYDQEVLNGVVNDSHDISVAVDLGWKGYYTERFGDPFLDAESLIYNDDLRILSIGKNNPLPEEVMAQYIGLIKLSSTGCAMFQSVFNKISSSEFEIGWGRPFRKAYMTDFLQELINQEIQVHAVPINRGWYEIDSLKDLEVVINQ